MAYERSPQWHTVPTGTTDGDRQVESSTGECLSENWVEDLADARVMVARWERTQRKAAAPAVYSTVVPTENSISARRAR